jgi:hypothetical protein
LNQNASHCELCSFHRSIRQRIITNKFNSDFSTNKKMPIGFFKQGSRSEPFPRLLGRYLRFFIASISPFFVIFKKSLLKEYLLKGKEKISSSRSPPSKNIYLTTMILTRMRTKSSIFRCNIWNKD